MSKAGSRIQSVAVYRMYKIEQRRVAKTINIVFEIPNLELRNWEVGV